MSNSIKRIIILGSTGSIGKNVLDVVSRNRKRFSIIGLSAQSNIGLLFDQIKKFNPEYVAVSDINRAGELKDKLKGKRTKVLKGDEGVENLLEKKSDLVVMAISGSSALLPLLKALDTTKSIALANKEALVMAGSVIMRRAKKRKVSIIPIDSEQSAIFQCLKNEDVRLIKKVYLTASGGPFRNMPKNKLRQISPSKALNHPRWQMGKKISVDSSTLMNKGLEFIEAMWLFDLEPKEIDILVHPEAIIHSMVEFIDGTILAQLAVTDMRIPIQYALTYPQRISSNLKPLDFSKIKSLNFEIPDFKKFPCLSLAQEASYLGGSAPCVLNAANEVAVSAFLDKRISFLAISTIIDKVLKRHKVITSPSISEIFKIDTWARSEVKCLLS